MNSLDLVKTQSCYAAICDEASSVNRLGFMESEFEAARLIALREGKEDFFGLSLFNDRLMRAASQGDLLSWTLLFDGVFRVVAKVASEVRPKSVEEKKNLGASVLSGTLACPTGRLIVTCLSRLGEQQTPVIEVAPGLYQVTVERNEDEEFEHSHIESLTHCPAEQGPDWRIWLSRVGPS